MNDTPAKTRPASRWVAAGAVILCTLAVCLVALEVGLRAAQRYPINSLQGYFAPGGMAYRLSPNISRKVKWPTTRFTVNTDDMGFRAKRPGPRNLDAAPYYAVLGSSEVFGNGLDYEETFIGVLAEKTERHGIDVVNMAVGGHGLDDQIAIFEEHVASARRKPEVVLVCLNPLVITHFDGRHDDITILNGNLFPKANWRMAYVRMALQNKSAAYCFFRDGIRHIQLRYLGRKDTDLSFYEKLYAKTSPIRTAARTKSFINRLRALEEEIRSLKATPVYVFLPTPGGFLVRGPGVDTQFFPDLIEAHCRTEGIPLINLEPRLAGLLEKGQKLNIDLDGHFNGPTSRVIGEYLYESLKPGGISE